MESCSSEIDMLEEIKAICRFEKRGPTKEGERKAAEYLKKRMEDIGLNAAIEPFRTSPHYYWVYFLHMVVALALGIVSIISRPLWVPVLAAALLAFVLLSFWGDLTTKFHLIRNLIPRFPSQNVVGHKRVENPRKHIIVVAHYDAPKVGKTVFNPDLDERIAKFFKKKFNKTPNVMMPMIIAMFLLICVSIARAVVPSGKSMWIATGIVQGIASLILIIAAAAFLDIATGHYVPGAIDNLTGVASCISIADDLVKNPLENSDFTFLATGCEEAIMMGMVEYIKKHKRELDPEKTYFINLESIGGGKVCYATSEGFVRVRPYSKELISIARKLKENGEFPEVGTYEVRMGTDGMVPLVRGFKAITIIAVNENNMVPNYHCDTDVPENVDISVTKRARDFALRIIRELDRM